jgi:hypothetical protein
MLLRAALSSVAVRWLSLMPSAEPSYALLITAPSPQPACACCAQAARATNHRHRRSKICAPLRTRPSPPLITVPPLPPLVTAGC